MHTRPSRSFPQTGARAPTTRRR
ncbi:cellulase S, partial [Xanthomonas oryzae pv. oryzae]